MSIKSPLLAMDLRPFVNEAAGKLGYFEPSITEWMVARMLEAEDRGSDLELVLDEGWREHLTNSGLVDPARALSLTYRRARASARDHAYRTRTLPLLTREPPVFPAVMFLAAPNEPCAEAKALDRTVHRFPPELPLQNCDREVCGCSWRTMTKRELEKS